MLHFYFYLLWIKSICIKNKSRIFEGNLTVDRNGNEIMNLAENMSATTNHAAFTLVYTGATNGWKLLEVA